MKKAASLIISLAILVLLYQFLDRETLFKTLAKTDLRLLLLSVILLIILLLFSGLRLFFLGTYSGFHMTMGKSVEATFAASALNIFLPGKLGDILKATLLAENDIRYLRSAVILTIWEKVSDLAMLFLLATISFSLASGNLKGISLMGALAVFSLGMLISTRLTIAVRHAFSGSFLYDRPSIRELPDAWLSLQSKLTSRGSGLIVLLGLSFLIWGGHIFQICLMIYALGVSTDLTIWANIAGLLPVAIVAGLVPLTFAGVGTRDAALVLLLGGFIGKEIAAALGILFWLRYLVPGIIGIPLLPKFMRVAMSHLTDRKKGGTG